MEFAWTKAAKEAAEPAGCIAAAAERPTPRPYRFNPPGRRRHGEHLTAAAPESGSC